LGALLVVGSISDHIGRRPTLLAALVVEIAAMLAFAGADGVGVLFAARSLQGLATGTTMGAISAALLDLQPRSNPRLGALMGAVAPMTGLALGALIAGLLVDHGPDPTRLVFWLLLAALVGAALAVLAIPETVSADGRWRNALRRQLAVPRSIRAPLRRGNPVPGRDLALGGLILSLGARSPPGCWARAAISPQRFRCSSWPGSARSWPCGFARPLLERRRGAGWWR
jgi:MFS family permease